MIKDCSFFCGSKTSCIVAELATLLQNEVYVRLDVYLIAILIESYQG